MTRLERFLSTDRPYLTDGGLETSLIYDDGLDLPSFAAFPLYESEAGRAALERYFEGYIRLARSSATGFVLDTATWRAGTRWGGTLGYDEAAIRAINATAVRLADDLRDRHETAVTPILVNGVVGPLGDGYVIGTELSPEAAEALHRAQVEALAEAGADMVTAVTMTHSGEAIGVARAAVAAGLPVAISFTVETDACLPSGETVAEAIGAVVDATNDAPVHYMINCAHPTHFTGILRGSWVRRIGGVRANASRLSHAELDVAETLDIGDPHEFGRLNASFRDLLPGLRVLGGCCGTDRRHIGCVARAVHGTAEECA
ncbi:homocysteine S-methyltransferase family protein [Rubellimicrobium arenae]|uniref:homocysteine S-methyltransferase family protein n=1 Tax=Rubellimicrobium arenae TaxID=2817372 RepID=UPI001B30514E|nr:homocysteine S-methyltransferase family protein [Rubellimicrobium arenae]